jgi:hypothetical protein
MVGPPPLLVKRTCHMPPLPTRRQNNMNFWNFHQDLPYFKCAQRMARLNRMACQGLFLASLCKVSWYEVDQWVTKKILHGEWLSRGVLACTRRGALIPCPWLIQLIISIGLYNIYCKKAICDYSLSLIISHLLVSHLDYITENLEIDLHS